MVISAATFRSTATFPTSQSAPIELPRQCIDHIILRRWKRRGTAMLELEGQRKLDFRAAFGAIGDVNLAAVEIGDFFRERQAQS